MKQLDDAYRLNNHEFEDKYKKTVGGNQSINRSQDFQKDNDKFSNPQLNQNSYNDNNDVV